MTEGVYIIGVKGELLKCNWHFTDELIAIIKDGGFPGGVWVKDDRPEYGYGDGDTPDPEIHTKRNKS